MKRKIVFLANLTVAFIFISVGYGVWEKTLTIHGRIEVVEPQKEIAENEAVNYLKEEIESSNIQNEENLPHVDTENKNENLNKDENLNKGENLNEGEDLNEDEAEINEGESVENSNNDKKMGTEVKSDEITNMNEEKDLSISENGKTTGEINEKSNEENEERVVKNFVSD
ncbi:MAG TPA: hypothetical protein GXX37_09420 [Clostridiaceae bacterium]|nr:hypothetical protein [Clostridiaceae bacterium]